MALYVFAIRGYSSNNKRYLKTYLGLYDLRAIDERDYEYRSRLELGQADDRWEITSAASATDPLAVARAKKLIAQLKLCFARDGVEYAYLYDLRPFVERDPATNEYLVHGTSLSDDAAVSAVFVSVAGQYTVVSAAALLPSSRIAAKKIRRRKHGYFAVGSRANPCRVHFKSRTLRVDKNSPALRRMK